MPKEYLSQLYTRVAKKVLSETLHVKKGESVTVETWDNGLPFARIAVAEARKMGCPASMIYEDEWAYVEGVRKGPEEVVGAMGKNEYGLLSGTDAYIFVPGPAIGMYSTVLKPEERSRSTSYNSSWYAAAEKTGLRGARLSFGYVGKDLAGFLGKRTSEVVRAQLEGALVDFGQVSDAASHISPLLSDGAEAELGTGRSVLRFSLRGERSVEDGIVDDEDRRTGNNMAYVPPGFVSKEVDPQSANGRVTISDSLTRHGVIRQADLEFEGGKLVSWESKDRALLKKLFDPIPPEEKRLELIGIGINPKFAYGFGQDRFVMGSITLSGYGLTGVVKKGNLRVGGSKLMESGRLGVA